MMRFSAPGNQDRLNIPAQRGGVSRFLSHWVMAVSRHARWVLALAFLFDGWLVYHTAGRLSVSTDTSDMISANLDWRRNYVDFRRAFPQLVSNLIVVIDAQTPELAEIAQARLAHALGSPPTIYAHIEVPGGGEFFAHNGLLYLDIDKLERVSQRIIDAQPVLGSLASNLSLAQLFLLLDRAMQVPEPSVVPVAGVLERLNDAFAANERGLFHRFSWREFMQDGSEPAEDRRRLVVLRPNLDYAHAEQPRKTAINAIRRAVDQLALDDAHGVRVRITGGVAMEFEELESVKRGAVFAVVLTVLLVSVVLYIALRSWRLIAASLLTLALGLTMTAGFAAFAVGSLNLISIAFAVLYIGLAIDFAIHFCLRYRELRNQSINHDVALSYTAGDVGVSLFFCAVTTAIGFYAFIPTDFSGVAQLGVISGTGMFISLFVTLTLLPAILQLIACHEYPRDRPSPLRGLTQLGAWSARHRAAIRWTSVVATMVAVLLATQQRFDNNPLNLRDASTNSVATFKELLADSDSSPLRLSVLEPDLGTARQTQARLVGLEVVSRVIGIHDFVPSEQQHKLAIIDELALTTGGSFIEPKELEFNFDRDLEALRALQQSLATYSAQVIASENHAAIQLIETLNRWRASFDAQDRSTQIQRLRNLSESVLTTFPHFINTLNQALNARPIALNTLPEPLVRNWVSADDRYRLEVVPRHNVEDNDAAREFVDAVRDVARNAVGIPVIHVKAGDAVIEAFTFALVAAWVLVTTVLLLLVRRLYDTAAVVFPLLLAVLLTVAWAVIFRIPFNFANVIALPLLLGIGVDSGIHMVHRARAAPPPDGNLLATSTARAVFFSVLTTICSFISLAFSAHPGTASMGQLLMIGMIMLLACSLFVLPTFLAEPRS